MHIASYSQRDGSLCTNVAVTKTRYIGALILSYNRKAPHEGIRIFSRSKNGRARPLVLVRVSLPLSVLQPSLMAGSEQVPFE